MMNAAKLAFVLFLAGMVYVLLFGHVNGDRGFAMCLLIIGCICQILYGPASGRERRRKNEVLVFHPQGKKQ
jgi:membrane associated rhomboid family serine protease